MADEKTYPELQAEAELLGIKKNQSAVELDKVIAEATSLEAVGALMKLNEEIERNAEELQTNATTLQTALEEKVEELQDKLDSAAEETSPPPTAGLEKIMELHEAQMADREVYTDPYKTGMANAYKIAIAVITDEDVSEEELIRPVTQQVDVKGAKVLTGRQRLIKAASEFITMTGGTPHLRSGLTPAQIAKADEIMKALKVEKGTYAIPQE